MRLMILIIIIHTKPTHSLVQFTLSQLQPIRYKTENNIWNKNKKYIIESTQMSGLKFLHKAVEVAVMHHTNRLTEDRIWFSGNSMLIIRLMTIIFFIYLFIYLFVCLFELFNLCNDKSLRKVNIYQFDVTQYLPRYRISSSKHDSLIIKFQYVEQTFTSIIL